MIAIDSFAEEPAIKFGSVAMDIPSVMHKRLTPLTKYLSESLDQPVNLILAKDMPDAIHAISTNNVDIAYLTPVAYIHANEANNAQLVAKMKTNNKDSFKLMIVVKEDSNIYSIEDIFGKSFAFGDEAALLQRAVVVESGLPLEKLGTYSFLKHYDNIVRAVLYGEFDAGILKDTMAYKWQDKGIRILHTSPELPPYNIAAKGNIDPELLNKLQKAFLDLDINKAEHHTIIKSLDKKYDGFSPASNEEYDIVRKLIKPFNN